MQKYILNYHLIYLQQKDILKLYLLSLPELKKELIVVIFFLIETFLKLKMHQHL